MGGSWGSDLGDEIHSTPELGGGRLYVPTLVAIYCFGVK